MYPAAQPNFYMNAPWGYPYADKIQFSDTEGIRRFLAQIGGADEDLSILLREATREDLLRMLNESHFTFDPDYYGVREIPLGANGMAQSALDSATYRQRIGIIEKPPMP